MAESPQAPRPRVLSLMQPTADSLHLGNYLGALKQWVALQADHEAFFGVCDLHALTVEVEPAERRRRSLRAAAQFIGAGVDPDEAPVFIQSHVPEHAELMWVLTTMTGFGQAARMTQFKDKAARTGTDGANVGLFTYPILMAADILLYQADKVPVGEDQRQHLELTRDLAQRFNSRFSPTFTVPDPHIVKSVGRIMDLQEPTLKMSKSSSSPNGLIELLDDPRVNAKKFRSAVTDSDREIRYDEENKPGVANLLSILSAFSGRTVPVLVEEFQGLGYGDLKGATADAVNEVIAPFRERTNALLEEKTELEAILARGADRARGVASRTLSKVYRKIGLLPPARR